MEKLSRRADILVVSATPHEALQREWDEHNLTQYTAAIAGKNRHQEGIAPCAAKYPHNHTLMIGDAPGDYHAAVANKGLVLSHQSGDEEAGWKRFFQEGIDRFLSGKFDGQYQAELLADFESCLPDRPPWPEDD